MSQAATLFMDLEDEMMRTRAVLIALPRKHLNWQPGPTMKTIGWNANHISEIIGWTTDILEHSELDIAPVGGPKYETPTLDDPAQIVAKFDSGLLAARAAIAKATDETLASEWSLKMGGQVLSTMKKGACLRKWVLNHTIHHRAILSVYLRMCGVEVTPVYDT